MNWRLLVEECTTQKIDIYVYNYEGFNTVLGSTRQKFLSWRNSLQCIVVELAGGGSVDVAVGVGVALSVGFIGFLCYALHALSDLVLFRIQDFF